MIRHAVLLIFRPNRFIEVAAQNAIEHEWTVNTQLLERYPDRKLPQERIDRYIKTARIQAERIRAAVLGGIVRTSITILVGTALGLALANWVGPPSKLLVYIAQALGAAVILGATLGEIGRDIQTFDGGTLPERVNAWMFRALYVIGTLLFVASFSWDVGLEVALH